MHGRRGREGESALYGAAILPELAVVSMHCKDFLDTAQGGGGGGEGEAAGIFDEQLLAKHGLQCLLASPSIRNR